jgi:hypothetical protein
MKETSMIVGSLPAQSHSLQRKQMRSISAYNYLAAWALGAAALGCGAEAGDEELEAPRSLSQELRCWDGSTNPECVWKSNWSRLVPLNHPDIAGGHYNSPALCVSTWAQEEEHSRSGWLAVSVDQNDRYEVLAFSGNVAPNRSLSWGVYGATKRWTSKPTCASREPATWSDGTTSVGGFLIAGKVRGNTSPPTNDVNHNKIFASAGRFAPWYPGVDWPNPGFVTPFEEVDPDGRVYATGGLPALGSKVDEGGFGAPAAVLVFMGTDQRTIYAHTHALPYTAPSGGTAGPWSERIPGPVLPCDSNGCWRVEGTPSIAREVVTFRIVVHATRTVAQRTSHRLYETYFYSDGANGHFSQFSGSPSPVWSHRPVPGVVENSAWIEGDPAIEYDPDHGTTLFFRQGSSIMQTSFTSSSFTSPPQPVHAGTNRTFVGSPAAVGGVGFDNGTHVAMGVGTDKAIYYIDSDGNIIP